MQITVGVLESYPIAYKENGEWTGFEIQLWEEVAHRNNFSYVYQEEPNPAQLLHKTSTNEIQVALGGLTRTTTRETYTAMSFYTLASGLMVGVKLHHTISMREMVARMFSKPVLKALWLVSIFAFFIAHGYWLIERGQSVSFAYLPGIADSLWWAFVTFSTVGYGDIYPLTMSGRLFSVLAILAGLGIFGLFLAKLTTMLAEQSISRRIACADDLRGKVVGVQADSTAVATVKRHGGAIREFTTVQQAAAALVQSDIDAVVADAPILQGIKDLPELALVGGLFSHQSYAFFVPHHSDLLERINHSLIEVRGDQTYDAFYEHYFN